MDAGGQGIILNCKRSVGAKIYRISAEITSQALKPIDWQKETVPTYLGIYFYQNNNVMMEMFATKYLLLFVTFIF